MQIIREICLYQIRQRRTYPSAQLSILSLSRSSDIPQAISEAAAFPAKTLDSATFQVSSTARRCDIFNHLHQARARDTTSIHLETIILRMIMSTTDKAAEKGKDAGPAQEFVSFSCLDPGSCYCSRRFEVIPCLPHRDICRDLMLRRRRERFWNASLVVRDFQDDVTGTQEDPL
jgi:hypothetical protein